MARLTPKKNKSLEPSLGFRDSDPGKFDGNGGGRNGHERALGPSSTQIGLWALLATLTMLFVGFTSAYIVRRTGADWNPITPPRFLYFNTGLLLASSLVLELARASKRRRETKALRSWLLTTILLGISFLIGQLFVWRQLKDRGIYLPTSPHSSFFFILTGVHGIHLIAGIIALVYTLVRVRTLQYRPLEKDFIDYCATYWHFVDGIWIYLFFILFMW